jgi:hypothetical protein
MLRSKNHSKPTSTIRVVLHMNVLVLRSLRVLSGKLDLDDFEVQYDLLVQVAKLRTPSIAISPVDNAKKENMYLNLG